MNMMNNKLFHYLVNFIGCYFLLSLAGCSSPHNSENGQETTGEEIEPEMFDEEELEGLRCYFLHNTDGFVYVMDDFALEELYEWNYDSIYPTFEEFKKCTLDGSINLNNKTIQDDTCAIYYGLGKFKIDSTVMTDYGNSDFNTFKDKYCRTVSSLLTFKDVNVLKDKYLTIAYCLWLSGYKYYAKGCLGEMYFKTEK